MKSRMVMLMLNWRQVSIGRPLTGASWKAGGDQWNSLQQWVNMLTEALWLCFLLTTVSPMCGWIVLSNLKSALRRIVGSIGVSSHVSGLLEVGYKRTLLTGNALLNKDNGVERFNTNPSLPLSFRLSVFLRYRVVYLLLYDVHFALYRKQFKSNLWWMKSR